MKSPTLKPTPKNLRTGSIRWLKIPATIATFAVTTASPTLSPTNFPEIPPALAQNPPTASTDNQSPTPSALPLPTIPPPTPTALPPADSSSVSELDNLLSDLATGKPKDRDRAIAALAEQDESMLPSIAAKLIDLRKNADREAMSTILEAARKEARKDLKRNDSTNSSDSEDREPTRNSANAQNPLVPNPLPLIEPNSPDWLKYVIQSPKDSQPYKDLVATLALTRTCTAIGTTPAARQIINVYTYFGDLFRIDVQLQLARLNDMAVPALIEAQYHDSKMVRTWAKKRLDMMGRSIPSEAVGLTNNQAVADVLRAYGRAREVDAVRAIVSFANSDRLQVRQAAREAIGQIGEPAHWQLRDAYEQLMAEKPAKSWDWQRTAKELFAVYDRARLQEVYTTMDEAIALANQGNHKDAIVLFDRVLATAPMFERRGEMVPTYLARAEALATTDKSTALGLLRRAIAIDPSGEHANQVRSNLAVFEAEELADNGFLDTTLIDKAIELDPANARAHALRTRADTQIEQTETTWKRYAAAISIGVVALAAMVFTALLPKRTRPADKRDKSRTAKTPDAAPIRRE